MNNRFWKGKRVLVTGGAGFIGSHVVEKLIERDARVTVLDNLQNGNLKNLSSVKGMHAFIKGDCRDWKTAQRACQGKDIVMNLAARVGGIEYNRTHQATMLSDNLLIGLVMTEAASKAHVKRFLAVSSACVYPHNCSIPTPESEGFLDEPEPTNSGYGWAKRMSELIAKHTSEEFGIQVGIVRPYNCYGPRDHFDLAVAHVIPALIRRIFHEESPLTVWGSGKQTRAFLYVEDCAEGMIASIEKYPVAGPINLGTDEEVTIRELVLKIIKIIGAERKIVFDTSKPDGSPRRNSDNRKAKEKVGFVAKTKLDEGLGRAIQWYKKNRRYL